MKTPTEIAEEIISVQPMDKAGEAWLKLYENALLEEQLKQEGYNPVSRLGLMWKKDNE
jgi:hypothetical protein